MIVVDTNVLAYAAGGNHALRDPCARLVAAIGEGDVLATTTVEAVQEFVHVHGRRRPRREAVRLGLRYADLFSPLLVVTSADLVRGLRLHEQHTGLGPFDAVLAAAALASDAEALISTDHAFAAVRGLKHVDPDSPAFERLLGS